MNLDNLSDIKDAGYGAEKLIKAVQNMHSIANQYRQDYEEVLSAVRTAFNDSTLTFSTMTDTQVNGFFLRGVGSTTATDKAKNVLGSWETLITKLNEVVSQLPVNDL